MTRRTPYVTEESILKTPVATRVIIANNPRSLDDKIGVFNPMVFEGYRSTQSRSIMIRYHKIINKYGRKLCGSLSGKINRLVVV